jgi:hypothetical protein
MNGVDAHRSASRRLLAGAREKVSELLDREQRGIGPALEGLEVEAEARIVRNRKKGERLGSEIGRDKGRPDGTIRGQACNDLYQRLDFSGRGFDNGSLVPKFWASIFLTTSAKKCWKCGGAQVVIGAPPVMPSGVEQNFESAVSKIGRPRTFPQMPQGVEHK